MENPLSGLISGTTKRPVIINGRLLTEKGAIVTIKRDNYKVEYARLSANRQEVVLENGKDLMDKYALDFKQKYQPVFGQNSSEDDIYTAKVDTMTGAIVMHNNVYATLLDESGEQHFHDGTFQFSSEVKKLLDNFILENTVNYFEIYARLINRRLMASYMPMSIKGYLVAGLFQPLVVQTKFIKSPLRLGDFNWFLNYLNNPEFCEETLESISDTSRSMELTAVAMCDIVSRFQVPLVREFNRLHWMFVLLTCLLGLTVNGGAKAMIKANEPLWVPIEQGRGKFGEVHQFMDEFYGRLSSIRNTIALR